MKYLWTIIIVGLIIWIFLIWESCNSSKQIHILSDSVLVQKKISDSIKIINDIVVKSNDSVIKKNKTDSVLYSTKIDSLTKESKRLRGNFLQTRDSLIVLYKKLQNDISIHDTVGSFEIIEQLRNKLGDADTQLFQWQINRDSSDYSRNAEIERLRGIVSTLQNQIVGFKGAFDTEFKSHQAITNDFFKLQKKARIQSFLGKIEPAVIILLASGLLIKK